MNTNKYKSFLIKSKLLSKIDIVYNNAINQNYYYIQNLKDFIDTYMDDNKCNISNNNLLSQFIHNTNLWDFSNVNIKKDIYEDMSRFIYNYDTTDDEMYDFLVQLDNLII